MRLVAGRSKWTQEEEDAIRDHLGNYIATPNNRGKTPGQKACLQAMIDPRLKNRNHLLCKQKVYNLNLAFKRKTKAQTKATK